MAGNSATEELEYGNNTHSIEYIHLGRSEVVW
jgi:hypothetical protein